MTRIFRIFIKAYAMIVSPFLGYNCRYHPTCSCYADEALRRHGALKGLCLTVLRILRCHPWSRHPFYDPVPASVLWRDMCRTDAARNKNMNDVPAPSADITERTLSQ